jgi:hypothetical protein
MKSLTLISTATLCMAVFGCSTAANAPTDSAGGETSSAGSGETAGTGTTVSGGATGASGSTNVAGTSSSSGGTSEGGTGGTGGSGETAGASAGGSAGASTAAGAGGSAGGGTAGAGAIDPTTFTGGWDGALIEFPCGSTGSGYDCQQPASAQCKNYNQQSNPVVSTIPPANGVPDSWTMGGTPGTVYNVTFHLRGVVEVTSYVGGTRDAGNTSVQTTPRDLFQVGGAVQDNTGPSFDYNTYELDVTPAVSGAANVYFLNSVTTAQNPHASNSPTTHLTFDIDYSATIKVPGGGKVSMTVTDSNCTQVQNCGNAAGNTCAAPRTVSLAGSTPPAPAFAQPFSNGNFHGQWVFFDVTNVTVAQ